MTTVTPTYPTLGHRLAAKLRRSKLRRKARPRAKRRVGHSPPKPRIDPRVARFKRQLGKTPNGRRMLQLTSDLARMETIEEVVKCGLEPAEAHECSIREQIRAVGIPQTAESYCKLERLQGQLYAAEHKTRRWRAEYQRHRGARERLEAEVQYLAGYL